MIPKRDKFGELYYLQISDLSLGQLLQIWMMSSFLYYEKDMNVIDDATFDLISKVLLEGFDSFEHQHKFLLEKEALAAGTGAFIREARYPKMVVGGAWAWYDDIIENKRYKRKTVRKTIRRRPKKTGLFH